MSKQIQAYFRTEDEAEGARTSLLTYHTEQLEVGQLQDPIRSGTNILVPLVPWNNSGTAGATMGAGTAAAPGGVIGAPGVVIGGDRALTGDLAEDRADGDRTDGWREADVTDRDYGELKYALSVKVRDEDYDAIVHKLRANHAYVERFD